MSDQTNATTVPPSPVVSPGQHAIWLLLLLAMMIWQCWMTLGLFGAESPWRRLLDDGPVLSGRHPLHLYHGHLGAEAFLDRGTLSCYDPSFHAGYPKTPVFDGGSRPAEFALALVGGGYSPAAYKISLAVICLLAPPLVLFAARGAGLGLGAATLAIVFTLLCWWGGPGRLAIESGDGDLLLAALLTLAQFGFLLGYHRRPGVLQLVGVVGCGLAGWFAQPLFMVLSLPLVLVYYLSTVHRHRLAWHVPLFIGLVIGVGGNAFWLTDWISYWWIRVPPCLDARTDGGSGLAGVWTSPLWGGPIDRVLISGVMALGIFGTVLLYVNGRRPAARLLGIGATGLFALVVAGLRSGVLARLGVCQLLLPALLFASLPAAFAVVWGLSTLRRVSGTAFVPLGVLLVVPALVWVSAPVQARAWGKRLVQPVTLRIGLEPERQALVAAVKQQANDQARILWEDQRGDRQESRWTALLPVLTGLSFVGGLDDGAGIEHATSGLVDGVLAGRPLTGWTDGELADYCRRYNIGWVVCSDTSKERFARWPLAGKAEALPGRKDQRRWLFRLARKPSFALVGSAKWRSADVRGILLADVKPEPVAGEEEGQVLLSLHYQTGMRVSPSRVRIEKAVDTHDNIPFVRLRMKDAVGRVLITWEGR